MLYKSFSGQSCFPLPVLLGGTFTSRGTLVTFSGILSNFKVGDYLYSSMLNEIKQVVDFGKEPNTITIESAFSSDITTAQEIQITDRIVFSEVDVYNYGGAEGRFNGEIMPTKTIFNIEKKNDRLIFTIDATSTQISILALL